MKSFIKNLFAKPEKTKPSGDSPPVDEVPYEEGVPYKEEKKFEKTVVKKPKEVEDAHFCKKC